MSALCVLYMIGFVITFSKDFVIINMVYSITYFLMGVVFLNEIISKLRTTCRE